MLVSVMLGKYGNGIIYSFTHKIIIFPSFDCVTRQEGNCVTEHCSQSSSSWAKHG